jgi:hypothetical protein
VERIKKKRTKHRKKKKKKNEGKVERNKLQIAHRKKEENKETKNERKRKKKTNKVIFKSIRILSLLFSVKKDSRLINITTLFACLCMCVSICPQFQYLSQLTEFKEILTFGYKTIGTNSVEKARPDL